MVDVQKVANLEKRVPDDWISPDGMHVTEAFHHYALSLIHICTPNQMTSSGMATAVATVSTTAQAAVSRPFLSGRRDRVKPVSYTHLDVYKRQPL